MTGKAPLQPNRNTNKEEENANEKASAERVKQMMKERREELQQQSRQEEKHYVQGHAIPKDSESLYHKGTKRREEWSRRVPKQLAKLSLFTKSGYQGERSRTPFTKSGSGSSGSRHAALELEDREVPERLTQEDLLAGVDVQTQQKKFNLDLNPSLGPYHIDFTQNGTHLLLGGVRGHLANIQWKQFNLLGETQLKDKINDLTFLVDHTMSAVAQKKYVYMYTKEGTEMHILGHQFLHMDRLSYLPKHFLLATASSKFSVMNYIDISTGQSLGSKDPSIVRNPISKMDVNRQNGVVATGDLKGVVKFWSPTVVDPLLELKAHPSVVEALHFHPNGRYFVSVGGDHKMKIWDTRTLRPLEEYAMPYEFQSLSISDSGLVAIGGGTHVQVFSHDVFSQYKPSSPFLKFGLGYGKICHQLRFVPFEDVLGVGHSHGFSSFLVPGAGEENPDFYYANPHETERHRQERVIHNLLDKLPPDTISMDVILPGVNEARLTAYQESLQRNRKAQRIRERKEQRAQWKKELHHGAEKVNPLSLSGGWHEGDDEELDEQLGFQQRPHLPSTVKGKLEKLRERKMKKWDKKETTDKVKSKQTMRNSRAVQRLRAQKEYNTIHGDYDRDNLSKEEEGAMRQQQKEKKQRKLKEKELLKELSSDARYAAVPSQELKKRIRLTNKEVENNPHHPNEELNSDFLIGPAKKKLKKENSDPLSMNAALKRFK